MTNITDEQRAALDWLLRLQASDLFGQLPHPHVLIAMLRSKSTKPQSMLPTEPGWYLDEAGNAVYQLRADGWYDGQVAIEDSEVSELTLRPLVPERPQITREQIESACTEARADRPNPLQVHAITALVNAADQ